MKGIFYMTIERKGVYCDGCQHFEPCEYIPFKTKVAKIKKQGWFLFNAEGNLWRHYCPECKNKMKQPEKQRPKPVKAEQGQYWWND